MSDSIDRKYLVILAAVAILVLVVGALLRPRKQAPQSPSPAETATLQARVQREELSGTASYLGERARAVAQYVVYDAGRESSAVAWVKRGQILTTAGPDSEPPLLLARQDGDVAPAPLQLQPSTDRWLVIVGRTIGGRLLWAPAVSGGSRGAVCAGSPYRELVVNAHLDVALLGAGAFDLDGQLQGVVARCGGSIHLIAAASVPSLLDSFHGPERRMRSEFGFTAAEFEQGLLVTEIVPGGAAQEAGLHAGDAIANVATVRELAELLEGAGGDGQVLEVQRIRRRIQIRMPSVAGAAQARMAEAGRGIRLLPPLPGGEAVEVVQGSAAYRAGLRTGDRVVQVGERRNPSAASLRRALSEPGDGPLLVVFFRGASEKAAVLR